MFGLRVVLICYTSYLVQALAKPPAFILAGDSTTFSGKGWGDGFLNTTLEGGAVGTNFGVSGATTASFRASGTWSQVLMAVTNASSSYTPYVTIQFGHNDQKATSGETIAEFSSNLELFVNETRSAGGTPVLLTPLSRRNYDTTTDPPLVVNNLADVRNGTIAAASAVDADLVHLNEKSAAYLDSITPEDAYTYNLASDDYTHLNNDGSIVFGGLVAELLLGAFPDLAGYLQVNGSLSQALATGTYYWPGVPTS